MPLMPTTPPVSAQARINSSGMLRGYGLRVAGLLWEKMTGLCAMARTSRAVRCPVWLKQTSMSKRSISCTTSRPNGVSPISSSWQPPPTRLLRL